MDWVISIFLFIIALGLLICLHELGHFSMAKLFNVYCQEFSIGFGPALLHKRKEGKETYFSIRAIPLGGYVSMYGEEGEEIEPGLKLPESRSLEGIAKWKKAIIISAGIIMNAIIALVLFTVKNFCFPLTSATTKLSVEQDSIALTAGIEDGDHINYLNRDGYEYYAYYFEFKDNEGIIHAGNFFIVDNDVEMNDRHYCLTFDYYTSKTANVFTEGMKLYVGATKDEVRQNETLSSLYLEWINEPNSPEYYPNVLIDPYVPDCSTTFNADLLITKGNDTSIKTITLNGNCQGGYETIGLLVEIMDYWPPVNERFENIFTDFGNSAGAVFKGLATLFSKGGIKNMSGVVGIFTTSKDLYTTQTFATYLFFWGLISVNLAVFNLLPFPGLDGWQLLVTIIEGVSKKKIPNKFKQIMSLIGFVLLMVLMVVILIVDIARLI